MKSDLIFIVALCISLAQTISAQDSSMIEVTLALKNGKTTYRMGEPIILDLSFRATTQRIQLTVGQNSPNDELVITPRQGVTSWLADSPFGNGAMMDDTATSLSPGEPALHILRALNAIYRFDKPGHYSVYVKTHRMIVPSEAGQGSSGAKTLPGSVTTNRVEFDIEDMSEADEQVIVDRLLEEMRASMENLTPLFTAVVTDHTKGLTPDQRSRARASAERMFDLKNELDWLTGNPSTRAKVFLYTHPSTFGPFSSVNLWTARNRRLAIALLEDAMKEPSLQPVSDIAQLSAQLKASLTASSVASRQEDLKEVQVEHVKEIAKTLRERTGENLTSSAVAVFTQLAAAQQMNTPEFATAREVLLTHFDELSPEHVGELLSSPGDSLDDSAFIPGLEGFLREHQPPIFGRVRDAAFQRLMTLAPAKDLRVVVVDAACDEKSRMTFETLTKLPDEVLPEADECLLKEIKRLGQMGRVQLSGQIFAHIQLEQKTMLAGRFATKAIYQPMLSLYMQYGHKWTDEARGGILAYLSRYAQKNGLALLKQELGKPGASGATRFLCQSFYSPAVNRFLEEKLEQDDVSAAAESANLLSGYGQPTAELLLRNRLDRWRKTWATGTKKIPREQGSLEAELTLAIIRGKNWRLDEVETDQLKQACVTRECRDLVQTELR